MGDAASSRPVVSRHAGLAETTTGRLCERMAASVAARLLQGSGTCSVVAFREDPEAAHRPLAHGSMATGQLALVLPTEFLAGPSVKSGEAVELRLRIDQHGAHHELRIALASLHALGRGRVVGDWDAPEVHALRPDLPDPVAQALELSGCPLVLVDLDRVLMHTLSGVTPFDRSEIDDSCAYPPASADWEAIEGVELRGEEAAAALVTSVVTGARPGVVGDPCLTPPSARHLGGRTLLADVDATGCTWVQIDDEVCRSVHVPFTRDARDESTLDAGVTALLAS